MASSLVECSNCKVKFLRHNRHINENLKLKLNSYCSAGCFSKVKNKQKKFVCENKDCKNIFKRSPDDISPHNFCSRSCASIYRNMVKWGQIKPNIILSEEERRAIRVAAGSLGGRNRWLNYQSKYSKEYIITTIKDFVNENNRLPVKKEMYIFYKQARAHFGTWNKAIEAAGFKPNPVLFANKQVAKDGHICDSLAEKIIDDYLFEKGIIHERNYPYPEGPYTADFKIGDKLIEYFGLFGEHPRYDELIGIKKRLVKKYKLDLVEVYPKNLFPTSKLIKLLRDFTI